jgi:hypothetical protein
MPLVIRELTLKALNMTAEEVQFEVDTIMGQTEEESMVWLNLKVKKLARENVIKPAISLCKKNCPESQLVDEDGTVIEMSDGAAVESICADYLSDPNWNPEESNEKDGSGNPSDNMDIVESGGTSS